MNDSNKFKVGDKVILMKKVEIDSQNNYMGWTQSMNKLIKQTAVIIRKEKYRAELEFKGQMFDWAVSYEAIEMAPISTTKAHDHA